MGSSDEVLVGVRPSVLREVEHALGNLFQRVYHSSRMAGPAFGQHAEALTGSLRDLEGLVGLMFDYVSPVALELRPIRCGTLLESLAALLRERGAGEIQVGRCPLMDTVVDRRLMQRCFRLLAEGLERELSCGTRTEIWAEEGPCDAQLLLRLAVNGCDPVLPSAEQVLRFEIARKLIELHGGELEQAGEGGRVRCTVLLPRAERGHGG